jgi:SAM-dependent methyltransferase
MSVSSAPLTPSAPPAPSAPAGAPVALDPAQVARRDALAERLFQATLGTMDLLTIYLGDRLGLYRALAAGGPATAAELATRAGTDERYTREWLEQQAAGGILDVEDASPGPGERRFALSAGPAEVLTDVDSLSYQAYLGKFAAALGGAAPAVGRAFRSGEGVSWDAMGPDLREGQAEQNRPIFLNLLGREWLPAIPDLHARLSRVPAQGSPPARVADFACGAGWSSIAIALAYPDARVDGYDLDAPAIEMARANATAQGVAGRAAFYVRDAADPALQGQYDLALICEALHDLPDPVGALRAMRRLVVPGGTVLVVDERVGEELVAPADDLERLMYGFSVLCCLPNGRAVPPTSVSAATGTVMRPRTLRAYATRAGFERVEVLPIEHDLFRLYRLHA